MDIDPIKTAMQKMAESRDYAEAVVSTVRGSLLVLDGKLTVKSADRWFYRSFQTRPEETLGRRIYELGNGQWYIPQLRTLLEDVLKENSNFDDFEVTREFPEIGLKTMLLNARRLRLAGGAEEMILLAIESVARGNAG